MSIYEEVNQALASDPDIALLYGATSPGDRSVLFSLLENDGAVGTTTDGSPNAQFWSRMAEYGWMEEVKDMIQDVPISLQHYRLTDRGYRAIPVLLSELASSEDEG